MYFETYIKKDNDDDKEGNDIKYTITSIYFLYLKSDDNCHDVSSALPAIMRINVIMYRLHL